MKQFFILVALVAFMTSCGGISTETDSVNVENIKVDTVVVVVDYVKTDTAK